MWKDSTQVKGLYVMSGRLGSAFSYGLSGATLDAIGMSNAIWISVGLTVVASVGALVQGYVDTDDDIHSTGTSRWESTKHGVHQFFSNVDAIYCWFAVPYFLIHSIVSIFTTNAPSLLVVSVPVSEHMTKNK